MHFNTEEPLKITIKTLPPEEKVRPRRPSLIAPSPARSSYESNPQPSTSSAPLPDPSVMDKRARKSSLFDDSPAKIVRPRRSSTFVPRSAYLDVDSDDNAPQPSTSIADPVLGKRARESSLVDHSSKRVRPRRLSTFLSSSAYLDVDSDDNAPQPSNAPVPLQLPKDSSAEAKKIKFMNALPQKPQKRSRTQKLVIPESNTISVIQAPTPEPSPSPSTSKAALVSSKRLFETNPPAKRTLPARRQSCFETNLDEISGAMKLKMKRNQNQSVVKPKLFGSELVDARKKKLSELVRKKKVEKMDKDVQVNTKQAPKQTNMPLNQEIVAR